MTAAEAVPTTEASLFGPEQRHDRRLRQDDEQRRQLHQPAPADDGVEGTGEQGEQAQQQRVTERDLHPGTSLDLSLRSGHDRSRTSMPSPPSASGCVPPGCDPTASVRRPQPAACTTPPS